jgi:hypothetical protein
MVRACRAGGARTQFGRTAVGIRRESKAGTAQPASPVPIARCDKAFTLIRKYQGHVNDFDDIGGYDPGHQ